jgi:hypothetical protein
MIRNYKIQDKERKKNDETDKLWFSKVYCILHDANTAILYSKYIVYDICALCSSMVHTYVWLSLGTKHCWRLILMPPHHLPIGAAKDATYAHITIPGFIQIYF